MKAWLKFLLWLAGWAALVVGAALGAVWVGNNAPAFGIAVLIFVAVTLVRATIFEDE